MLKKLSDIPGGMCVCNAVDEDAPEESIVTLVSLVVREFRQRTDMPKTFTVYNLL